MVILLPKIGQRHFGACASHCHNLAIFHPFWQTKITFSSRRIEWNKTLSSISLIKILVFGPHFCSKASHGQYCTQIVGTCPGHHGQLISQNCVLTKIRGVPPPSLIKQAGIIIHKILNLWETKGVSRNFLRGERRVDRSSRWQQYGFGGEAPKRWLGALSPRNIIDVFRPFSVTDTASVTWSYCKYQYEKILEVF